MSGKEFISVKKHTWADNLSYCVHYYGIYILGGVLGTVVLIGLLVSNLHKEAMPDYRIALMTGQSIQQRDLQSMERIFSSCADDRNQDGVVWVELEQYAYASAKAANEGHSTENAYENMAEMLRFSADTQEGACVIYLLSPETKKVLETLDPNFFLPMSQCIDGISADTLMLTGYLKLQDQWADYEIAVRNPNAREFQNQQEYWKSSVKLLEKICEEND